MATHLPPQIESGQFERPNAGWIWEGADAGLGLHAAGLPGWQSNGGPHRGHPCRAMPSLLEVEPPAAEGKLKRIHVVGLLALWAEREHEPDGTTGAALEFQLASGEPARVYLVRGSHYSDARDPRPILRANGDGTQLQTQGSLEWEGQRYRVDALSVDVPEDQSVTMVRLRDLGTPASFVIFDVLFEHEAAPQCPFRGHGGHVSLSEVGQAVRLGDRRKFGVAVQQLDTGLAATEGDLDEARSLALTFIAVVSAAVLERGGTRDVHRVQLQAARAFEALETPSGIVRETQSILGRLVPHLLAPGEDGAPGLIDRALEAVDRYYARPISDSMLAERLGLSTSHFRHLFREATGQPFHRYLINVRLENARSLLQQQELTVTEIALKVGFTSPAHFTRAFAKRFNAPPSSFRR